MCIAVNAGCATRRVPHPDPCILAEIEPGHVNASKYLHATEQHMLQLSIPVGYPSTAPNKPDVMSHRPVSAAAPSSTITGVPHGSYAGIEPMRVRASTGACVLMWTGRKGLARSSTTCILAGLCLSLHPLPTAPKGAVHCCGAVLTCVLLCRAAECC